MDPEPPEPTVLTFILSILPALAAAVFASVSAAVGALSESRRAALCESLTGRRRAAVERYASHHTNLETRWLVWRVFGITCTAFLLWEELPHLPGIWRAVVSALGAAVAYGLPAQMARAYVLQDPATFAPRLLLAVRPLELLVTPVAEPISWLTRLMIRKGSSTARNDLTETEVELLINEGEKAGSLGHDQGEMIRNVLDFGEIQAIDVMVPRTRVTAFSVDSPIAEVLRRFAKTQHSRYPVYSGETDNIIGILHVKDLIARAAMQDIKDLQLRAIIRQPVAFVPETQLASTVLTDMRAGRHHMAVVIDEFGGYSGIVTIEDLIEEIVGDIRDEHDEVDASIVELDDGKLIVDAGVSVSDLSRHLGIDLPEEGDYTSVGGLVIEKLGRMPDVGASVSTGGVRFVVREADERHVVRVEVIKGEEGASAEQQLSPDDTSKVSAA